MSVRRLARNGGIAALVLCAVVGLSFLGAASLPDLDPFVDLAPLFAAFLAAVLILVAIFWRRWAPVILCVIALAGPVGVMGPEVAKRLASASPASAHEQPSLKIITANVWTLNFHYQAFKDLVAKEDPDIVFLQEAFKGWRTTMAELAPEYRVVAGCFWPHECNVVILSKLEKVGDSDPYDSSHVTARLRLPARLGGDVIEATSIHLSRPPPIGPQIRETAEIRALVKSQSDRAVLGGDFNATPWSTTIKRLDESLKLDRLSVLRPTWPSFLPIAPVDHLFAGPAWKVVDVHVGPNIGSDHRPVIATLQLDPKTAGRPAPGP